MSTTQYTATIRHTAPTPRNKKGTTTATTPSQGTTIITTDTTPSTNTNQHTHHNLTSLNQINTTPADGYLYLDTTDPTTGATTTTKAKAAYADTANEANHAAHASHADEATHANTADTAHNLDNWTTADQRYLSRQTPDTAAGHITFSQGTTTQGTAKSATYNGNTDFSGQGWAILPDTPNGQTTIVADNLRLRGTLTAHELIIEQIRAICGALGITQACGKIKDVTLGNQSYHITLEGDPEHGYGGFMVNDLVRCQRWDTQRGITGYWARVVYAQGDTIKLLFADFLDPLAQEDGTTTTADTTITPTTITDSQGTPITLADAATLITTPTEPDTTLGHTTMAAPAPGDNLVQYGNTTDLTRQAAIYLHANGQGQPAIDILTGINTRSFSGCLTASLGRLPDSQGFGLWSRNGRVLSTDSQGTEHYSLNPDGTFQLGQGAITYNGKGLVTIGQGVTITWGPDSTATTTYATAPKDTKTPPSSTNFTTTMPTPTPGSILWTCITWPDGTKTYTKAYYGTNGTDGKPGTNATLPAWLNTWQGQTTTLGTDYVAAPAAAFGTKNTSGQFTGIIISAQPLDLGLGTTTTTTGTNTPVKGQGLWAVANDKARVLIDPAANQYLFNGSIVAPDGQYNGLHIGSSLNGIAQISSPDTWADHFYGSRSLDDTTLPYRFNPYRLQPVNIITYTPKEYNTAGTAFLTPRINLPSDNTTNAYAYMLQYIGFTLYIINKSGTTIQITNPYTRVNTPTANTITTSITTINLPDGATLIAQGQLNTADSVFYWHTTTGQASADTPSTPVDIIIPSDRNPLLTLQQNNNLTNP